MQGRGWSRRDVILELVAAAGAVLVLLVGRGAWPAASGAAAADAPRDREARRRWALARMDEMAHERRRCRERFRVSRQVRDCEAQFERRHRAYNELYIDASRE